MRILHSVECSRLSLEFFSKWVYTLSKNCPYLEFFGLYFPLFGPKKLEYAHFSHSDIYIVHKENG